MSRSPLKSFRVTYVSSIVKIILVLYLPKYSRKSWPRSSRCTACSGVTSCVFRFFRAFHSRSSFKILHIVAFDTPWRAARFRWIGGFRFAQATDTFRIRAGNRTVRPFWNPNFLGFTGTDPCSHWFLLMIRIIAFLEIKMWSSNICFFILSCDKCNDRSAKTRPAVSELVCFTIFAKKRNDKFAEASTSCLLSISSWDVGNFVEKLEWISWNFHCTRCGWAVL